MNSLTRSLEVIRSRISDFPQLCIVLGSGWNSVLSQVVEEISLPYQELFGVTSSVPGHDGRLVIGSLHGQRVALMSGRFHTYEGYSTEEVTRPLQVFAQLGLKQVILTSAVGALNQKFAVGDFVVVSDFLTLFCPSPLTGPQFVDMSQALDEPSRQRALRICAAASLPVHEGVYVYMRGPHFETPADKMALRHLGGDVVGMSMVPETIMARNLGVKVLGLAFVTNLAFVVHDHQEVLAAANQGSQRMGILLKELVGPSKFAEI